MSAESEPAFPVSITIPVLWGDMDAFGHVNNVIYIRWFESSRVRYLENAGMREMKNDDGIGPILAGVTCNYRRQLFYPDTVTVSASVTRIGRSSMTIAHRVYSETQDAIVADGESTVVIFNFNRQRPIRVPDEYRTKVQAIEGRSLE